MEVNMNLKLNCFEVILLALQVPDKDDQNKIILLFIKFVSDHIDLFVNFRIYNCEINPIFRFVSFGIGEILFFIEY